MNNRRKMKSVSRFCGTVFLF